MERVGQNPAETQFNKLSATSNWIKGYTDKLCYLAHSEEMYWEIRFHSLLTLLLHWQDSCKTKIPAVKIPAAS